MLRIACILPLLLLVPACCRSPYGCSPFGPAGTRVPPPATGSFGMGNAYYPGAIPRATATPSTAPRTLNPSSGWRTSTEDGGRVNSLAADGSATVDSGRDGSERSVQTATTMNRGTTVPRTDTVPIRPRFNGMPINEAQPAVSPASFESPESSSNFGSRTGVPVSGSSATRSSAAAPTGSSPSNALRDSSAAPQTSAWRSRPAPAPNRIAGN